MAGGVCEGPGLLVDILGELAAAVVRVVQEDWTLLNEIWYNLYMVYCKELDMLTLCGT
jgi:hypothetical protein